MLKPNTYPAKYTLFFKVINVVHRYLLIEIIIIIIYYIYIALNTNVSKRFTN